MMSDKSYAESLGRLYETQLHTIDEMLTVVGVPEYFDNSTDGIPTVTRVRWLIDQWLEAR